MTGPERNMSRWCMLSLFLSFVHASRLLDHFSISMVRHWSLVDIQRFMSEFEINQVSLELISRVLQCKVHNILQYYEAVEENNERLELLSNPIFIGNDRLHNTIYSPKKLLRNPKLASSIFRLNSGVTYQGRFFGVQGVHETYFVELYKIDPELTMCVLNSVVDHQMTSITSISWMRLFVAEARVQHVLAFFTKLSKKELTPLLFDVFKRHWSRIDFQRSYINVMLPENVLFIHCMAGNFLWSQLHREIQQICYDRYPEFYQLERQALYEKLRHLAYDLNDRASKQVFLAIEAEFREPGGNATDIYKEFLSNASIDQLSPHALSIFIERVNRNYDILPYEVPESHLPMNMLSLDRRRQLWLYHGPLQCTQNETQIIDLQIGMEALSLNGRVGGHGTERVANSIISEAAQRLSKEGFDLKSDMPIIIPALGYAIAEKRKLDLSRIFMSSKPAKRWCKLYNQIGSVALMQAIKKLQYNDYFTLTELRLLVDLSFKADIDSYTPEHSQ